MFVLVTFLKAVVVNACAHVNIVLCYVGNIQKDLVPPSHFASSVQSAGAHRGVQIPGTQPPISWINPGVTSAPSGDPSPANPWLAITQAQQEILELRKENQRIMMLQGDRGRIPLDHPSDRRTRYTTICFIWSEISLLSVSWVAYWLHEYLLVLKHRCAERSEQWSRWESEWHLEAEKHKAEAERLKGQVEALKETAGRHREEMRDRDSTLNR